MKKCDFLVITLITKIAFEGCLRSLSGHLYDLIANRCFGSLSGDGSFISVFSALLHLIIFANFEPMCNYLCVYLTVV